MTFAARLALAVLFFRDCTTEVAPSVRAITFSGGGFRAQSSYAGFTSGLLAAVAKQQNLSNPTLVGTGLFSSFEHVSSNSGGSWFASSLAYSKKYSSLIESMAASPQTAATQHKTRNTTPWLLATNADPEVWERNSPIATRIAERVIGNGDLETIALVTCFLSSKCAGATGCSWHEWTETLLNATASIDTDVLLGSPVMAWARGKNWLSAHSLLLPTGSQYASLYKDKGLLGIPEAAYSTKSTSSIPLCLPAMFNIKMGTGENSTSPHPYVAPTAVPDEVYLDFTSDIVPIFDEPSAVSGKLDKRDFAAGVLTAEAGKLPVVNVASASSAFLGTAPVFGAVADEALAIFDADLTPWVSNSGGGQSFKTGYGLVESLQQSGGVSKAAIGALAANQVHGVIDGGSTDNSGIANAVVAGSDEVVVVLNSNSSGFSAAHATEVLFKGGPIPTDRGMNRLIYPIFESFGASTVQSNWEAFHSLTLPATVQQLKSIHVGTFMATTAENKWFGITGGKDITLHIVDIGCDLTIGYLEDFNKYDVLVQDIVDTINSNENVPFVTGTLLPLIMGRTTQPSFVV